jgi:hypothetical protein
LRDSPLIDGGLIKPDCYALLLSPNLPPFQSSGHRHVLFPNEWKGTAYYGFALVARIGPGNLWIYHCALPVKLSAK